MSIRSLNWAFDGGIPSSSCKFVLVALADFANEDWQSYPSVETLCRKTSLERKTVISCMNRLEEAGFLKDTGLRKGATKQVKVLQIMEQCRNWNSSVFDRKGAENGTGKASRKRDTEPSVGNHQKEPSGCTSPVQTSQFDLLSETSHKLDPQDIVDFWNSQKLPQCRVLTEKRKAAIAKRSLLGTGKRRSRGSGHLISAGD